MQLLVTYLQPPTYDDATKFSNSLIVTSVVQRQPVLQGYRGLGIVYMVGEWATSQAPAQISGTSTNPDE
jgi:hypothetical protein